MPEALQELEAKLAAAFDTADWDLDTSSLSEMHEMDECDIRPVNMDLAALGGSRPRTNT